MSIEAQELLATYYKKYIIKKADSIKNQLLLLLLN